MNVHLTGLNKVIATLDPKLYQKATNRTINDIGSKVTTQMTKEVRLTYNIKAKELKGFMKVRRSRYENMKYELEVRSSPLNAIRFGAKKLKKRGKVSVRIKKANGRKTLRNTFLSKSGGAVLHRIDGTQEIEAVSTLSIPQMFNKKILKNADNMARREFGKKLKDNFNYYIGKV